jgi:DNA-binding XRE family transcriptional regulator
MEANEFRVWRTRLGWTQAEVADKLGVTVRAIKHYEGGTRRISPTIEKLCDRVGRHGYRFWKRPGGKFVARNDIKTPPRAARFLHQTISASYPGIRSVFDPCAGDGRLLRPWTAAGCSTVWWEIKRGRDFFVETELPYRPDLWVLNPPFNGTVYKEWRLGPEAFLQKIFELCQPHWQRQRIAMFAPAGFRLNNRVRSRRGKLLSTWKITSTVSLPVDFFDANLYAEIILFNMPRLRGHYTLS